MTRNFLISTSSSSTQVGSEQATQPDLALPSTLPLPPSSAALKFTSKYFCPTFGPHAPPVASSGTLGSQSRSQCRAGPQIWNSWDLGLRNLIKVNQVKPAPSHDLQTLVQRDLRFLYIYLIKSSSSFPVPWFTQCYHHYCHCSKKPVSRRLPWAPPCSGQQTTSCCQSHPPTKRKSWGQSCTQKSTGQKEMYGMM